MSMLLTPFNLRVCDMIGKLFKCIETYPDTGSEWGDNEFRGDWIGKVILVTGCVPVDEGEWEVEFISDGSPEKYTFWSDECKISSFDVNLGGGGVLFQMMD